MSGSPIIDENIGGSRSGFVGRPTESMVIVLTEDIVINDLQATWNVFNRLVSESIEEKQIFLTERYFGSRDNDLIAEMLSVSIRTLERWNKEFLIDFALEIGLLEYVHQDE